MLWKSWSIAQWSAWINCGCKTDGEVGGWDEARKWLLASIEARKGLLVAVEAGGMRDGGGGILFRILNRVVRALAAAALRTAKVFCDCWLSSHRVYWVSFDGVTVTCPVVCGWPGIHGHISGHVRALVGHVGFFLAWMLGSNGCRGFLLEDLTLEALHKAHVARTLLAGFEASERKQESRRSWAHDEQYLEDITTYRKQKHEYLGQREMHIDWLIFSVKFDSLQNHQAGEVCLWARLQTCLWTCLQVHVGCRSCDSGFFKTN